VAGDGYLQYNIKIQSRFSFFFALWSVMTALVRYSLLVFSFVSVIYAVEQRKPYTVPLAVIAYYPAQDSEPDKVCVWFDKASESWEFRAKEVIHLRAKDMQTVEEVYRKPSGQEFLLSTVEAELIDRVAKTLVKTLEGFELDLKNKQWDKCLFLDSYLAQFCCGFYHLITMAKSSTRALPAVTCPPESLYDRSAQSPKSDARIAQWRNTSSHVLLLRIATKELIYQIKQWQKKELENPRRNPWKDQSGNFVNAYELFVRVYFNMPPKDSQ